MANTRRQSATRRNQHRSGNSRGSVTEGNAVRRVQEIPERKRPPQADIARKKARERKLRQAEAQRTLKSANPHRQPSPQIQINREKTKNMNRGFVVFLSVVSAAVLFFCIHMIKLRSEVTAQIKTVAALESELTQLKEDNDAYESQVTSNVDLNEIKKIAIGRLGMKYPSDDQKMTYEKSKSSYVRQYQDVPETR